MSELTRVLEEPWVYRLWQAPFARQKIRPVLRRIRRSGRLLDVGCGPGTNARLFAQMTYVGLDVDPRYLHYARRRYSGVFVERDISRADLSSLGSFDAVLVNSVLHHLDQAGVQHALSQIERCLARDGEVHLVELVLPDQRGIARVMARLDRGRFPRALAAWQALFAGYFDEVHSEVYTIGAGLWELVYFQGRRKS